MLLLWSCLFWHFASLSHFPRPSACFQRLRLAPVCVYTDLPACELQTRTNAFEAMLNKRMQDAQWQFAKNKASLSVSSNYNQAEYAVMEAAQLENYKRTKFLCCLVIQASYSHFPWRAVLHYNTDAEYERTGILYRYISRLLLEFKM